MLGLSKVNEGFMGPINEKLEGIEESLGSIGEVSEHSATIVEALKAGDKAKAAGVVLEFYEIGDAAEELKGIKEKVGKGEKLAAAVSAADAAKLGPELIDTVKSKLSDTVEAIKSLVPTIVDLGKELADKVANIGSELGKLSFAEKVGTAAALKKSAGKTKDIKDTAEETKGQLEQLKDALANLKS
jgi:hypothetical protein